MRHAERLCEFCTQTKSLLHVFTCFYLFFYLVTVLRNTSKPRSSFFSAAFVRCPFRTSGTRLRCYDAEKRAMRKPLCAVFVLAGGHGSCSAIRTSRGVMGRNLGSLDILRLYLSIYTILYTYYVYEKNKYIYIFINM